MNNITMKEVSIEKIVEINKSIPEFSKSYDKNYFENKYKNKEKLLIIAYQNNQPAGYIIAYDKYNDYSIYCWMAGVSPNYRKQGILKSLMNYLETWAKSKNYNKVKITTRNTRREMLSFLIKEDFNLINVVEHVNIQDNRVHLEKTI